MGSRKGRLNLSAEEKAQVLDLLLQGRNNRDIARLLGRTEQTIGTLKRDYLQVTMSWRRGTEQMQQLVQARRKAQEKPESDKVG